MGFFVYVVHSTTTVLLMLLTSIPQNIVFLTCTLAGTVKGLRSGV